MKDYLKRREPATKKTIEGGSGGSSGGGNVIDMKPFRNAKTIKNLSKSDYSNIHNINEDQKFKDFMEGMKYQQNLSEMEPMSKDPKIFKKISIGVGVGAIGAAAVEKAKKYLEDLKKKEKK